MEQKTFKAPPSHYFLRLYGTPLKYVLGRYILLLTVTGRNTGLPRTIPLQYEPVGNTYQVGSARGAKADWFLNIVADGRVEVQVMGRRFPAIAEPITDPCRVADFLALRLCRHPFMVGRILRSAGLPRSPSRAELEQYAQQLAMVILHPQADVISRVG